MNETKKENTALAMQGHEFEEIRISVEEAQAVIGLKNDIEKLTASPLFKKVIGEQYFNQESIRLVSLMGEDNLDDKVKLEVNKMMFGIAYFQRWLRSEIMKGYEMEQYVKDAADEVLASEADEEQEVN